MRLRRSCLALGFALAAMVGSGNVAGAIKIVWDPTNFIMNLLQALEAIKQASDTYRQYRVQYEQYRTQLQQLQGLSSADLARLKWQNSNDLETTRQYIRLIDNTYGSVQNVRKIMDRRFAEQAQSGLSWEEYLISERERVKRGVDTAVARAEYDRRALEKVNHDYQLVREFGEKIEKTQGTHQATQLLNAQMNKVISQNAELIKTLTVDSMERSTAHVDEAAEYEATKSKADRLIQEHRDVAQQSTSSLEAWKRK